MAIMAMTLFSCASTDEGTDDAVVEGDPIEGVELVDEVEEVSNDDIAYEDMFEDMDDTEQYDVLALAKMEDNLSTFVKLVELSGLEPSIKLADPVTILAPTNAAFETLEAGKLDYLMAPENRTELMLFVQRHILPTEVYSAAFNTTQIIESAAENEIPVETRLDGTEVYIGGALILEPDVEASNGIIHVVDNIVEPSEFTDVTAE